MMQWSVNLVAITEVNRAETPQKKGMKPNSRNPESRPLIHHSLTQRQELLTFELQLFVYKIRFPITNWGTVGPLGDHVTAR